MAHRLTWLLGALLAASVLLSGILYVRSQRACDYEAEFCELLAAGRPVTRSLYTNQELLREFYRADTIMSVMRNTSGNVVDLPVNMRDSLRTYLEQGVIEESGPQPRARVALIALDRMAGISPALDPERLEYFRYSSGGPMVEVYTHVDSTMSYCTVALIMSDVVRARPRMPLWTDMFDPETLADEEVGVLGPCVLWARHGPPGAAIDRWLRSGGYRYGTSIRATDSMRVVGRGDRVAPFKSRAFVTGDAGLYGLQCLQGVEDRCTAALLESHQASVVNNRPSWSRRALDSPRAFALVSRPETFGPAERAMLFDLERYFGTESFLQFWRSEQDFEAAFNSAFGRNAGDWVLEWARTRFYGIESGGRLDLLDSVLTLLMALAFGALTVAVVARRQVQ